MKRVHFMHEFPDIWNSFCKQTIVIGSVAFSNYLANQHGIRAIISFRGTMGTAYITEENYLWLKLKYT